MFQDYRQVDRRLISPGLPLLFRFWPNRISSIVDEYYAQIGSEFVSIISSLTVWAIEPCDAKKIVKRDMQLKIIVLDVKFYYIRNMSYFSPIFKFIVLPSNSFSFIKKNAVVDILIFLTVYVICLSDCLFF